ncbi:heme-copper oxidase subunit III [bacterium]|nr:heme-copper oxidase subunit III [bacterium]
MSVPVKDNGVPPRMQRAGKTEMASCGMLIGYVVMSMLFLSGVILYIVVMVNAPAWPPSGWPGLPGGMWVSTLILLLSSGTLFWAHVSAKGGSPGMLKIAMLLTFLLGLAFLILQALNWKELWEAAKPLLNELAPKRDTHLAPGTTPVNPGFYISLFFILTGLHAAHVIGGVIWLFTGTIGAFRGYYQPGRLSGLFALGQYWHFLDVVWVVLFTLLLVTT